MNAELPRALSWLLRLLVLTAVLSMVCFGILVWRVKPLAVAVCPVCFGFEKIESGIYVEHGMPVEAQVLAKRVLALAEERVRDFYGDIEDHPRVLICANQTCIGRIGGGDAASGAVGAWVLLLGPKGMNEIDIAHELSLIEVSGRIGLYHSLMDTVPAWFDEGVAVVVSDAPEFAALAKANQNGCLNKPTDDLPVDKTKWVEEAGEYPFIYAQAGCRVSDWMATRGGSHAVSRLLARIAQGEAFDKLYAEH
ncbi:MAG TPA: hypothetical protein VNI53_05240 [Gammaproteobacteria bacterium]|nr:hypothetical protein [Gammaproteobacteria bacterium]